MQNNHLNDIDPQETREWLDAIESVIALGGMERAEYLINQLIEKTGVSGAGSSLLNTPYLNTISLSTEKEHPGDLVIEEKITNLVRWNALVMVIKANQNSPGLGGHISTFASSAVLYEAGYNHFFKGRKGDSSGDQIFFQGHASPGVYARAFVEGLLSEKKLDNFRRELAKGGGLPSYPHPRLMPDFWQFPTVSMGIGPLTAVYTARFNKYLKSRKLKDTSSSIVWAFLGDGELDEPESLCQISLASREKLDNLIFVVNCNLQGLDGPVRGNGSIVREVESIFRGAGWDVIKVLWSSEWDPLFEQDTTGAFDKLFSSTVDGDFQKLGISSGKERREFLSKNPELAEICSHFSDEELGKLRRGGHDYRKVYAAYHWAVNKKNGRPTVIIAKTVKGFGMGKSGEARNIAHQQKQMSEESLEHFVTNFSIPVEKKDLENLPYLLPEKNSPEANYLKAIRAKLGKFVPGRLEDSIPLPPLDDKIYQKSFNGTGKRKISTTKAFVQILSALLRDKQFGRHVVPIIPDEARTFGMEGLFRSHGIYSSQGQLYQPIDSDSLMPYREAVDGQILQEGINEAGSLCSFIAAGTSYSTQGVQMLPFYSFYSMFGFQRVGDFIWAASDMKCRGFLMGGTAGRTTLNGEGLQHEDGHSLILSSTFPNIACYDPAYEYEMAVIIKDGIKRMCYKQEDVFYYITMYNEDHQHPSMPPGVEEGIVKGMYLYQKSTSKNKEKINLIASGVMFKEVLKAAEMLKNEFDLAVDVYSAPSFKRLREEAIKVERENKLNPEQKPKLSYLETLLKNVRGTFVAVTDHMRLLPDMIRPWVPGEYLVLGTDGFGRSSSREELRRYFEIDKESIVIASLYGLVKQNKFEAKKLQQVMKKYHYQANKLHGLH